MNLRELRYIVALADHGHFGRAAEACHISQPTLSTQLKKLEDDLDVVLFERTNKALHITPVGRKIVEQARRVLAEVDTIVQLSRASRGPLVGSLTLGVIPTLAPHLMPWLIPLLKRDYPALRLVMHEDLTDRLIDRLRSHRIDAAVLSLPLTEQNVEIRPLFDEPFFLICPREHPLAEMEKVCDVDLHRVPLLLLTDGHCLREQALAVCGQRHPPVAEEDDDFRATSLETLRQMVAAGMGVTLLPALAVSGAGEHPYAVRPLDPSASRRIGLVWRRGYSKEADLELLTTLICQHLPSGVRST